MQAKYSIPVPSTLSGIYAPIKKPTAALTIPINPPNAEVERKNDTASVANKVDDSADKNTFPITANTCPAPRYQPDIARYIKPIASIIKVMASVHIYEDAIYEKRTILWLTGEESKSQLIPRSLSATATELTLIATVIQVTARMPLIIHPSTTARSRLSSTSPSGTAERSPSI